MPNLQISGDIVTAHNDIASETTVYHINFTTRLEWFVSKSGSDITGDGTQTSPFLTIQHAINAVKQQVVLNSMPIIYVSEGAYIEELSIGNCTVGITGVGDKNNVIIGGTSTTNWYTIYCNDANLNIRNVTIKGQVANTVSHTIIRADGACRVVIDGCVTYSASSLACDIMAIDGASIRLANNDFLGGQRQYFFIAAISGTIRLQANNRYASTVTSSCFCYTYANGTILGNNPGTIISGTITGDRYIARTGSRVLGYSNFPATSKAGIVYTSAIAEATWS